MNYKVNLEDQQIRFPEIGTYGEPDWVTMNEDGSLIEDESEVRRNRNDKILFKSFYFIHFVCFHQSDLQNYRNFDPVLNHRLGLHQ